MNDEDRREALCEEKRSLIHENNLLLEKIAKNDARLKAIRIELIQINATRKTEDVK